MFDNEIVAGHHSPTAATHTARRDVRAGTTAEGLAGLEAGVLAERRGRRFPEIEWRITPGNSSPLTDGASAALIMSEETASKLGLTPRARFHSFAVAG